MKREELIAYDKWLTRRKWGTGEIISPEKAADLYLAEQPLPPAEGATAEEFLKGCEHDGSFIPVHEVIRLMNAFAASQKQQPTAEGKALPLTFCGFVSVCPLHKASSYRQT